MTIKKYEIKLRNFNLNSDGFELILGSFLGTFQVKSHAKIRILNKG